MNTTRIRSAINSIEECTAALAWLDEYGGGLTSRDTDCATVVVHLNYASACPGAKEAQKMLTAFARHHIEELVEVAKRNCRNTIELSRAAIKEESER